MPVTQPRAIHWTRGDYYKMAEVGIFNGRRVELIEGDVIEMSPQDPAHASVVGLVDYALKRIFRTGFVVRVQLPLSLGLDSDPEPDIAVVRGDLRDHLRKHPEHALLVIEVAGTSLEFDRTRKAGLYAGAGVEDYWIVNLVDACVEVYRKPRRDPQPPRESGFGEVTRLASGQSISPLALPEASIPVVDLLP